VTGGSPRIPVLKLFARLAGDLTAVLGRAATGTLKAQVAARFPLTDVVQALEPAESGTVTGKVVLGARP
jgi:NADPH:quinone reductase-like Zn-dependent oxidoreductase